MLAQENMILTNGDHSIIMCMLYRSSQPSSQWNLKILNKSTYKKGPKTLWPPIFLTIFIGLKALIKELDHTLELVISNQTLYKQRTTCVEDIHNMKKGDELDIESVSTTEMHQTKIFLSFSKDHII